MDLENQGNGPDSSSNIPFRKKRGRPCKDQSQNPDRTVNLLTTMDQTGNDNNHSLKEDAAHHNDDVTVGQIVSGVIEATFDSGYLLSVRIGNSDTTLRGIAYKPGHYAPVPTHTDVAPTIQMMSRNTVSFSAGNHTPVHCSYRRGRGRLKSESRSSTHFSAGQLQVAPPQPATLDGRGSVVPVILDPDNLSDCVAPAVETPPSLFQPAHLAASKARFVDRKQAKLSGKDSARNIEGSTVRFPSGMMEELVNEVVKRMRMHGSTQSKETRDGSGQASGAFTNEKIDDLNEPLLLETVHAVPQKFGDARPGKMTELLLENGVDNKAGDAQYHVFR